MNEQLFCKKCNSNVNYTVHWDSNGRKKGSKRFRAKCAECKCWIKRLKKVDRQQLQGEPPNVVRPLLRNRLQKLLVGVMKSHNTCHPQDKIPNANSLLKRLLGALTATETVEDFIRLAQEESGIHYDNLPDPQNRFTLSPLRQKPDPTQHPPSGDR